MSDADDLNKLVFAVRVLYDRAEEFKLCDELLNEFCLSMSEKTGKFESINFHLLRHLAWQAKSYGPLFTTSTSMFESANHWLIAPLTCTVNHCELMTSRFLRRRVLSRLNLIDENLGQFFPDGQKKAFNDSFGFVESKVSEELRNKSSSRLFCRMKILTFYLSSTAYCRGRAADRFVSVEMNETFVGEVQFFFEEDGIQGLFLRIFDIKKRLRLLKNRQPVPCPIFGYVVKESDKIIRFPTKAISNKLFPIYLEDELTLVTMLRHFEHD